MPKLLLMPPHSTELQEWAKHIQDELPVYTVILPKTDEEVNTHLPNTDAVYGWVSPKQLSLAKNLQWLQSPACRTISWILLSRYD